MIDYSIYNFEAHELLCGSHVDDDFIKKFINKNGTIGKCAYCKRKKTVIELSTILELIVVGINYLFEDPIEFKYYDNEAETGFDGDNFYFEDLFYNRLELNILDRKLSDDIFNYLNNDSLYYSKDEYGSHSEYLSDLWNLFQQTVRHKARFVFYYKKVFSEYNLSDPVNILISVQDYIKEFKLFKKIFKSQKLYRCRQHSLLDEVKEAKDLCSPPYEKCFISNRMSAIGISMFYCGLNEKACINEVVNEKDRSKPYYTTAFFKSNTELNLVDMTNLPDIPSIYDEKNNKYIEIIFFLKKFVADLSKPFNPSDSSIEYIPTQIVTEYIKFNPELLADGIIYPSSKNNSSESIVLFKNHEESLEGLEFYPKSIITCKI